MRLTDREALPKHRILELARRYINECLSRKAIIEAIESLPHNSMISEDLLNGMVTDHDNIYPC